MGAPTDSDVLGKMADALDALASKLWFEGDESFSARLNHAADALREPFEGDEVDEVKS